MRLRIRKQFLIGYKDFTLNYLFWDAYYVHLHAINIPSPINMDDRRMQVNEIIRRWRNHETRPSTSRWFSL